MCPMLIIEYGTTLTIHKAKGHRRVSMTDSYYRASLPSIRKHPSYGDCLEVKREYYQNSSVLDCVTMFTVCSTLM